MIFRADSIEKILDGRKTQTRRPVNGPCSYRVGQDYSVQPGRTKREVARILIRGIRRETLRFITESDARREGFDGPYPINEFMAVWQQLYPGASAGMLVDVIDFDLVAAR